MRTTAIDWHYPEALLLSPDGNWLVGKRPPVEGAKPVYWYVNDEWVHKGWLMPQVGPT